MRLRSTRAKAEGCQSGAHRTSPRGLRFVIPLGLAFLIGLRLRAWWWALSPFLVIVVTMLAFSVVDYLRRPTAERQQAGAGLDPGDRRNGHRCRRVHPRRHSRCGDWPLVAWRLSEPPCPLLQNCLGGRVMTDPSEGRPPASSIPRQTTTVSPSPRPSPFVSQTSGSVSRLKSSSPSEIPSPSVSQTHGSVK